MNDKISRRQWLSQSAAAGTAAWLTSQTASADAEPSQGDEYKVYFGDLHNHNEVGYARGALERTFEIARNHLDFFAFTPHGYWNDIGHYENSIENKWLKGFDVTRDRWPEVLATVRRFNDPGKFVSIAGFEWHSTNLGDYHIIFPSVDIAEYARFDKLADFQRFAKKKGAIMIPHHPANRLGHRGANLAHLDPEVSPVIEMFSEWGNAEHDLAPSPYIRHSHGGRWTQNTLQHFLSQGYRLGVVASTDDHLGFPGGYREGLAAVYAKDLTTEGIFDALRNRRTYAVSGDRIGLDFRLNGRMMGSELPYVEKRELAVDVTGWDQVDRVEILKNNRVIHRDYPMDRVPDGNSWNQPVLLRFEYGWGPWAALGLTRVCDWKARIELEGGVLEDVQPCFQSGPLEEERRDRIVERSPRHIQLESHTALRQQFEDISTKAVVLKVRGTPETRVTVRLESPSNASLSQTFKQLAASNEMLYSGGYPTESAMLHPLVFHDSYHTSFKVPDRGDGKTADWYYARVVQANEQYAWSSPIWVDPKA